MYYSATGAIIASSVCPAVRPAVRPSVLLRCFYSASCCAPNCPFQQIGIPRTPVREASVRIFWGLRGKMGG